MKINNIRYAEQQLQLNYLFKRERFFSKTSMENGETSVGSRLIDVTFN